MFDSLLLYHLPLFHVDLRQIEEGVYCIRKVTGTLCIHEGSTINFPGVVVENRKKNLFGPSSEKKSFAESPKDIRLKGAQQNRFKWGFKRILLFGYFYEVVLEFLYTLR